jgi:hypothetical protein
MSHSQCVAGTHVSSESMKPAAAVITASEGAPSELFTPPAYQNKSPDAQRHASQVRRSAHEAYRKQQQPQPSVEEEHISFWRTTSHGDLNLSMPAMEHDAEVHPAPLGGEEETGATTISSLGGAPLMKRAPVDFHEHGYVRDELTGALHHVKQ